MAEGKKGLTGTSLLLARLLLNDDKARIDGVTDAQAGLLGDRRTLLLLGITISMNFEPPLFAQTHNLHEIPGVTYSPEAALISPEQFLSLSDAWCQTLSNDRFLHLLGVRTKEGIFAEIVYSPEEAGITSAQFHQMSGENIVMFGEKTVFNLFRAGGLSFETINEMDENQREIFSGISGRCIGALITANLVRIDTDSPSLLARVDNDEALSTEDAIKLGKSHGLVRPGDFSIDEFLAISDRMIDLVIDNDVYVRLWNGSYGGSQIPVRALLQMTEEQLAAIHPIDHFVMAGLVANGDVKPEQLNGLSEEQLRKCEGEFHERRHDVWEGTATVQEVIGHLLVPTSGPTTVGEVDSAKRSGGKTPSISPDPS